MDIISKQVRERLRIEFALNFDLPDPYNSSFDRRWPEADLSGRMEPEDIKRRQLLADQLKAFINESIATHSEGLRKVAESVNDLRESTNKFKEILKKLSKDLQK